MGGKQGGAFFLDQDKPNQGREVKSWRPRKKESAQESQTGLWQAASSRLNSFLKAHSLATLQLKLFARALSPCAQVVAHHRLPGGCGKHWAKPPCRSAAVPAEVGGK